ncbi:P-loop containing nucleoside triphosphate hydrolase protein [Cladochytrium replicatum]|nr:P-loop containing nucleoside triphosphate hydrolase protein [Cladochytrium replicatum]
MATFNSFYNFKRIMVVPNGEEFLDVVLSKIQRKTPTVIHANFKISRIRSFYMRKVRYAQEVFDEKLGQILQDFPKLDEIHPFYAELMNVLYDRDHYKLALSQINTARHLVDNIAKDMVKLLKFGDSLFRCKQLKRAALGRMATVMKRQKQPLQFLEQVRQHLARLPSIDPNTRTLLVCGYPNVGKSSFMNKVTRAEVDVQPYAFTTKSLFVGHLDHRHMRWQVIDTPGILDHPLEQMNVIEMQSITALAHLRSCILYFMDLSEECGYSVQNQINLFRSIKPLFHNKLVFIVVNKIDKMRPEDLREEDQAALKKLLEDEKVELLKQSCFTDEGVMEVKNTACDRLLAQRTEAKLSSGRIVDNINRLHLAVPTQRDNVERPAFIPDAAKNRVKYDANDPNRRRLERDLEKEQGGAGVYNVDLKKVYMLEDDEWKYDVIPEIMDGKNFADFYDPQIESMLNAIEEEEARLEAGGFYEEEEDMEDDEDEEIAEAARVIEEKKAIIVHEHRLNKGNNRPHVPRKVKAQSATTSQLASHLESVGVDPTPIVERARGRSRKRRAMSVDGANNMEVDDNDTGSRVRSRSSGPVTKRQKGGSASVGPKGGVSRDRSVMGLKSEKQKAEADKHKKRAQKRMNQMAKQGEADRHIAVKLPKHLFTGKRGIGKADHR